MSGERWRFLDSGPLAGAENMALDEAIFEAHLAGETPPTLRVYSWRPPAISLGRFQRAESAVDLEACQRLGIDVVRRPTGGRAILHTVDEVTFSIVVSAARLGAKGVMECYRVLAQPIIAALRLLGVQARLLERTTPAAFHPDGGGGHESFGPPPADRDGGPIDTHDPACFAVKARCDVVVGLPGQGSRKLVGSAQVQRQGCLLQQNSLPLHLHLAEWRQVFLRSHVLPDTVGLSEAVRREVSYPEVAAALRDSFEAHFSVDWLEEGVREPRPEPLHALAQRAKDC